MGVFGLLLSATVLTSVPDVVRADPQVINLQPETVVTGVVSSVFRWLGNSCLLVDPADADGPAVYVGGKLPDYPRAVLYGAGKLERGDLIEVKGWAQPMLLEPGVRAEAITVLGRVNLPEPALCRAAEVISGARNNRRVTVEGVLWNVRVMPIAHGEMTELTVGTPDGPLTMHVADAHPELSSLRNVRIRVAGVALPMSNARGEFLYAELEAFSPQSIRAVGLEEAPPVVDLTGTNRGVLAWGGNAFGGHLVRLRGSVVFVDRKAGSFVLRLQHAGHSPLSVRVYLSEGARLPALGASVVAEGFPMRMNDCGVLDEGSFTPVAEGGGTPEPEELSGRGLKALFSRQNELGEDFDCRFVRLRGRVQSVSERSDGSLELHVQTSEGVLLATLEEAEGDFAARFIDRPVAVLTGVLDTHLVRNAANGRILAFGDVELRLRTAADVVCPGDAESRARRFGRIVRLVVLYSTIPLSLAVAAFLFCGWRRRVLSAALAEDRRRTAEALHDTVSQQLAGARMMIFSATARDDLPADVRENLRLSVDVLESARREVRDAVLRLKNDDFSLKPAETLIREVAALVSKRRGVRTATRLCAFPDWVTGEVKTDLVSIVQEAVTNAVKHGRARRLVILAGRPATGGFVVSVLNDGAPFEVAQALGPEAGHFGLAGMRERANRCGFELTFGRRRGWTEVRLERRRG